MALQKALNQLRDSTINNAVHSNHERTNVIPITEGRSSTTSVFSVDDADLFNFDDDDFLQVSFSLSSSSSTVQPTLITSSSVSNSNSTSQPCPTNRACHPSASNKLQSIKQTAHCSRDFSSIPPSTSQPKFTSNPRTQSSTTTVSSPSVTNSKQKLQSFKFIKMGKKRPSDATDEFYVHGPPPALLHPPQTKRRLICDNVTNFSKEIDDSQSEANRMTGGSTPFKQPMFNPRMNASSSVPSTPTRSTSSTIQHATTPTNSITTPISSFPFRHTPASNLSTPLSSKHTPQSQQSTSQYRKTAPFNLTPLTSHKTVNTHSEVFSTPRNRSATPMVCTPTNNRIIGTPVSVKRKFPGPAGLLPSLPPGQNLDSIIIPPPSTPQPASTPRTTTLSVSRVPCAEAESDPDDFSRGPWVDMLGDLDMNDIHSSALLQYSIHSMIKQAAKKRLKGGKVVHLRVLVKNLVPAGNNASAVLKDPTGEILCTIHHKVLEEHERELQPGSVLVLRQVSVFSPTPRKHYLNITPNNIVRIYPPHSQEEESRRTLLVLSDIENRRSKDISSLHRPENSLPSHSQTHQQENHTQKKSLYSTNRLPFLNSSTSRSSQLSSDIHNTESTSGSSRCDKNTGIVEDNYTPMETEFEMHYNETNVLFEDLDDFEDFTDECGGNRTDVASSGVCPSKNNAVTSVEEGGTTQLKDVRREVTFFNQFCEDEFDNLVNDIDF